MPNRAAGMVDSARLVPTCKRILPHEHYSALPVRTASDHGCLNAVIHLLIVRVRDKACRTGSCQVSCEHVADSADGHAPDQPSTAANLMRLLHKLVTGAVSDVWRPAWPAGEDSVSGLVSELQQLCGRI